MSKKADQVMQEQLAMRWATASNPAAGSSAACTSRAANPLGRLNMDTFIFSMSNLSNSVIAGSTVSVRNSAIAGTIIAQMRVQVPVSSSKEFAFSGTLHGKVGQPIFADMTGSGSSVAQNIAIAGWEDTQR